MKFTFALIISAILMAALLFWPRPTESKPAKVNVPGDERGVIQIIFDQPVVNLPLCVDECSAGTGV